MSTKGKIATSLLLTLLLAACGGGVAGTYAFPDGTGSLTLTSSGKAALASADHTRSIEMTYVVKGDKIVLQGPGGNLELKLEADGSLDTPWGKVKKQ